VVDGQGKKMSKSIGNVIAPEEVIKKYGAEILRLWVSSEDYRDDIKISDEILKQLSDAYRKIRNTLRYLLGNLADFTPATDRIPYHEMEELDRWALLQFEQFKCRAVKAYDDFDFHVVFHGLHQFCGVTMSAFYLDIIKDRLYTSLPDAPMRKSAQTVLYDIAKGLMCIMAPVMSFTAAEAWEYLPEADPVENRKDNVFLEKFPVDREAALDSELEAKWQQLLDVRSEITRALEIARQDKVIGHPLEAKVQVAVTGKLAEFLTDKWETLQMISIVSELSRAEKLDESVFKSEILPELQVSVVPAAGDKCERCWLRSETVGGDADHPQLCRRCTSVVGELE
jgi:isoleucyl-tRNA synthetase